MQPLYPIKSKESPREIIATDFESLCGCLPIRGGWGYSQEDACVIDKNDPIVNPSLPFDGISVEYVFVEKRIYEEMIIFRPDGEKFSGIRWELQLQSTVHEGEKVFDKLVFEIAAFPEMDWEELKAEFEGPQGYGHPEFDGDAHERKRQEKMVRFTREFWFDITSFYGQVLVIIDKATGEKKLSRPESFRLTEKSKEPSGRDSAVTFSADGRNCPMGSQPVATSHSNRLIEELAAWFHNLICEGKEPLKAFTGYKRDGSQFVCILSGLGLERGDDLDFMHLVIKAEDCLAFAMSMHVVTEDNKEKYDFLSAQEGEYWYATFEPSNAGLKLLKSRRSETPMIFFHEILTRKLYDEDNSERLLGIWAAIRERIFWRRPEPQS